MNNMEIWEKVRSVPEEAKKIIEGGRLKGMTDINPVWRIKKLTEIYGPAGVGWYTDEVSERTIPCGNEIVALVTLKLYVKTPEGWSKPIFGSGGSMLYASEKNGMFASDEALKMAYTDALSVACKSLGIAADVYFPKDKTKYTSEPSTDAPKPDPKKELIGQITKLVYPDFKTPQDKGNPDGFCFEIYQNELKAYMSINKDVKKLSDLNLNQLKDMLQKMDVPECLR